MLNTETCLWIFVMVAFLTGLFVCTVIIPAVERWQDEQ